ncbi:hypothetical protein PATY110618_27995 [Paenibacillus typhae]|uniref:Uncharacterized protein n=1 Tax=Paenibacillus typhae TaxID=1174501 RepID=A0A1G9D285_9BACL|nr:hypothetical protein SAMN05216192_14616 [Paenibacillus typhae]
MVKSLKAGSISCYNGEGSTEALQTGQLLQRGALLMPILIHTVYYLTHFRYRKPRKSASLIISTFSSGTLTNLIQYLNCQIVTAYTRSTFRILLIIIIIKKD